MDISTASLFCGGGGESAGRELAFQQLDLFAVSAPQNRKADAITALELMLSWTGNIPELMEALPPSIFMQGPGYDSLSKELWPYSLSPSASRKCRGAWPVVYIYRKPIHDSLEVSYRADILSDYEWIHGQTFLFSTGHVILTDYAIFDLAGRYLRPRNPGL